MKKYLYCFQNGLFSTLIYKGNLLLKLITTALDVAVSVFMWLAVYQFSSSDSIAGITPSQMLNYLVVVNLLALVFSTSLIFKFSALVRSGNLSVILLRPISFALKEFFEYLGSTFPFVLIYMLFFAFAIGIHDLFFLILSLVLIVSVYIMFFLLVASISLCSFWLIQVWPLRPVITAAFLLLGGQSFPLQVLPNSLQWLIYNPFSLAGNQLTLLVLKRLTYKDVILDIALSCIWSFILIITMKLTWIKGLKSYEGVGG